MGKPEYYYKHILAHFAYIILTDNGDLMKAIEDEYPDYSSIKVEELEKLILERKENRLEKEFFYNAGIAAHAAIVDAENNGGIDGFNACVGGLTLFKHFLGLLPREEKENG